MTDVRPTMLYAIECWDVKEKHIYKMFRWNENIKIDKWKYKEIWGLKWKKIK